MSDQVVPLPSPPDDEGPSTEVIEIEPVIPGGEYFVRSGETETVGLPGTETRG